MTQRVRLGLGPLTAQTLTGSRDDVVAELGVLIDAVVAAEGAGFDAAWVSEHHLAGDGYLTSPLPLLAALARETTTIGLGTAVALAPLYEPLRLAEDAALVDALSGGRLLLGLGTGYRAVEFQALGLRRADAARRLVAAVAFLRAEWSREGLTPPPILLGGFVEAAVRRAGRLGDGWIAPTMASPSLLTERLGWLAEEGAFDRPFHVVVNIGAYVGEADASSGMAHVEDRYRAWAAEPGSLKTFPAVSAVPPSPSLRPAGGGGGRHLYKTAESCSAALAPWHAALAAVPASATPHLNVRLHYPGVGRDATLAAVRLFADAVAPQLRQEDIAWT